MPCIRVDTSQLTYPWFWLPRHLPHFVDGSVPGGVPVSLAPGEYAFQQTRDRASDVRFTVTRAGTVDFDEADDHLMRGRGTSTLHVLGVRVILEATSAPTTLLPMWGGCREPLHARARTVRMPPGANYVLRLGLASSEVVEFSVRSDGAIDYGPEYERSLSGRGTPRLRVAVPAAR